MKLGKLTIRGLASIADATIDFSAAPLADAPLFLLCGETGAGKTTILDAICLALYGQTPRYQDERRRSTVVGGFAYNDPLQLVRRGAAECRVSLTLRGNDGRDYEAVWCVVFYVRGENRGRPREVAWEWRDLAPGGLTHTDRNGHLTKELIPAALGLDFDQFCRTTLLAQGRFTEFLLAGDDEKAAILEKLTSTERFSRLGIRIADAYDLRAKAVERLDGELGRLAGMPAEERAGVERELREVDAAIESGGRELESLRAKRRWLADRMAVVAARDRAVRELAEARAVLDGEACRADARTVAEWDLSQPVHESVRGLAGAQADRAAARELLAGARAEFARCRGARDWLAADAEARRREAEESEESLAAAARLAPMYEAADVILRNLADARGARDEAARLERGLAAERKALEALRDAAGGARSARDAAQRALDGKAAELRDAECARDAIDIAALRERRSGQDRRLRRANEALAAAGRLAEREAELARRREALERKRRGREELGASLPGLEEAVAAARSRLDDAEKDAAHQRDLVEAGIDKVCSVLHVGDSCPVCGGRIERLSALGSFKALFDEQKEKCDRARRAWEGAASRLNAAKARAAELDGAIGSGGDELAAEAAGVERARESLLAAAGELGVESAAAESFGRCAAECEAALRAADAEVREYDARVGDANRRQKEKDVLAAALRERERDLAGVSEKIVACQGRIDGCAGRIRDAESRFDAGRSAAAAQIALPDWERRWKDDPQGFEGWLRAEAEGYRGEKERLPGLRRASDSARQALAAVDGMLGSIDAVGLGWSDDASGPAEERGDLIGRLNDLTGAIRSAKDAEGRSARRVEECERAIREFVDGCEGMTRGRLVALAGMDVAPARRRVQDASREVATREGALTQAEGNLERHLAARPEGLDDSVTDEALAAAAAGLGAELAARQKRRGEIGQLLSADDRTAADRKAKEAELEAARRERDEWKPLSDRFGDRDGRKIRRVIQSYVLRNVLVNANHYLRQLSPDRYELACVGLTLTVRDAFEGGVERPAKTLSGGEQFLVSLALALGLAGMGETGLAVDVLFIDEGFGTLSRDHLEKAIDELEKLNAICGNRKVGIISHVDRLKERVRTRIEVRRLGHEPSTVEVVSRPWRSG